MILFALATIAPLALFATAFREGGAWPLVALIYMTLLAATLDQTAALFMGDAPEGAEFPAADALLVGLALSALALLPLTTYAIAADTGATAVAKGFTFVAVGLWLGQVANPAAHELIHRGPRGLFRLGVLVYAALLFGHHASAHRLVHHRHAATPADPNSARSGEGYYAFFLRAWLGSFRAGLRAENDLRARARRGLHPYVTYSAIAAVALALAYALAGWAGVAVWGGLALHAQSQLLLSDYVQHYGLTRARRPDGRLEPVADRHSWNAPYWFTSALMLNAPRHSDHHAHPDRPYPALRLPDAADAPRLPWPLPVACVIALIPPLWRRAIRPALAPWNTPH